MKILVTGAAGTLGSEVVKQLEKRYDVKLFAMDLKNSKNEKILKDVRTIWGDITDKCLWENDFVDNFDAIIHLAAIIPPLADKNPELAKSVNVEGTRNIVNAIQKKNKTFLLYASSISVYGDRVLDYWINVGDELRPSVGDEYAKTKIEAEKIIQESKIPHSIFRLSAVMDKPELDPLMFHMPLDTKLEIITTKDAARACINALDHERELDQNIYNLGGGRKYRTTYREFLTRMFEIYGLNIKYLNEEAFATQNFHCGYYKDSNKLNDIVDFQIGDIDDYYRETYLKVPKITRICTQMFSRPIIYFLNKSSEPLQAKMDHDEELIKRFYK